jgi:Type IV leader peptidase family
MAGRHRSRSLTRGIGFTGDQRHSFDRLPIIGWWTLWRESALHGAGYWVRPMIIERLFAVGLMAFYFFELDQGLLAANAAGEQPDPEMLLAQFRGHALLTALVGMATGGLLVWFFRIVFGWVLAEEANGFGDGTLKAVIGAFLGWQATLIVLVLAPFAAVAIAVGQWLLTGRRDIAFGPYLCFAAMVLIVRWDALWQRTVVGLFSLGWLIPAVIVACVGVMGPLLWIWRRLRG